MISPNYIGGLTIILPSGVKVDRHSPIYPNSNFTWGEATKNLTRPLENLVIDAQLIKTAVDIETAIVNTARNLDAVRSMLGNRPIHINSWYRPKLVNASVGGEKWSRHQYGDAVDIRSNYYSPAQIYKLLNKVHLGGLGKYYNFIHLDWRGYNARWFA